MLVKKEMFTKYSKELRFLITGGSSTLIDFIIYMVLSSSIKISVAKFISMTVSSVYSFFINKNWTFSNKEKVSFILIVKYIFCMIVNIIINTSTNSLIFKITQNKIISFVIATGVAMIANFLIQKEIVFRGGKK